MTIPNYEILDLPNLAEGAYLPGKDESLGTGQWRGSIRTRGSHDGGKIGSRLKGNLILQGQFGKTGKARHGDH